MLYDLSRLKEAGIEPAKFIKCNNEFLALQSDFLESLLIFLEKCDFAEPGLFLVRTMENLT